ncbi:GumC family protein [Verrucomicrobiota bacterium sgz303538]
MIDSSEVKLHFLDYWRVVRVRAGLITLVFLLVMITAGVTTYFLPRQYFAKVSMVVKPDSAKAVNIFEGASQRSYDPAFVATEFQTLRKAEILYPVIKQLDLVKYYSGDGPSLPQQTVLRYLNNDLILQEIRNTSFIEIGVYNTDPQLAANIANTIAVVYQNQRLQDQQGDVDRSLRQFRDEVEKQRKVVEDAMVNAAKVRERDAIVDPDIENPTALVIEGDRSLIAAEQAVNEQRTKTEELRTKLKRIETLKADELMEVLRTLNIEDRTVQENLPLLQQAAAEEAKLLASGLGDNHPKITALRRMSDVYRSNLSSALEAIRRAQATNLKVSEDTLAALEQKSAEVRDNQIKGKSKSSDYTEAKAKYINAKKILEAAELRYSSARMERGIEINPARIWEKAEPPVGYAKPPVKLYIVIAALLGIVIGVGLAFFIEYLDTSVKTLDDVERFLQIPVLAVVPKGVGTLMKESGDSQHAEAYRILRANVEFNKPGRDANTFTLISGGPGEGKSTTLNNLAYTCAKGGYNVLVVDADLRRPSQQRFFDVDNSFGLTDYLTGKAGIDEITTTTKIDNLSFIPSGQLPPDSVGILNSQRMIDLMQKVKHQYDLVFFDSPPILGVSDGSVLASEVDMTIMVVQHRRFPRAMLQRVKQAVIQVGGTLIGVVLNNVDTRHDEGYSYYNNYNEYYSPRDESPRQATGPKPRRPAPAAPTPVSNNHGDY